MGKVDIALFVRGCHTFWQGVNDYGLILLLTFLQTEEFTEILIKKIQCVQGDEGKTDA